jgi:hypothetical protein
VQTLLDAFVAHITAPLVARIDELEKAQKAIEPTPEFVEKVRDAVLADDGFDDAVVSVMSDRASEVVSNLEDDIKNLDCMDAEDTVRRVLRDGSFDVSFDA